MEITELVKKLLQEMHHISKTETVVGEPLQVGKSKVIPICKLTLGFGAGGGNATAEGATESSADIAGTAGGAGGGVKVQPVAFVAVDPEGGAQLLCLDEPAATVIDKLLTVAPDLVDKVASRFKGDKAKAMDAAAEPEKLPE